VHCEDLEGRQLLSAASLTPSIPIPPPVELASLQAMAQPTGMPISMLPMSMSKVTLNDTSNTAPAITSFGGATWIAWTGTDAAHHLNVAVPGVLKVTLPDTSYYSPALAVYNNRLYLAWTGTDGHLNLESSADGVHFGHKVTLNETSYAAPTLAVYTDLNSGEERLAIGWTGTDLFRRLNVASTVNGVNFFDKVTLNETSYLQYSIGKYLVRISMAPSLASFGGYLWIAWTGSDAQHHLNTMVSTDGDHFGEKATLSETSLSGPSLAHEYVPTSSLPDRLFIGWTGTGNNRLNYMSTPSTGNNFGGKVTLNETGYNGIALFSPADGDLKIGWAGTDPQHHLNLIDV
jgi:hypothetical protein